MDGSCQVEANCPKLACPSGSPTLCPNGACVRSYRECGVPEGIMCPEEMSFKCFDGSCQSSPAACIAIQLGLKGANPAALTTAHNVAACNASVEQLCWNGACIPLNDDANCLPVPKCPFNLPFRCADGTCIDRAVSTCGTAPKCPSNTHACEDGSCRQTCLKAYGCPLARPLQCGTKSQFCFTAPSSPANDHATCFGTDPQVCWDNCNRDDPIRPQVVAVSVHAPAVIDVVLNSYSQTKMWIEIPAGSLGGSTNVRITPIVSEDVKGGYVLVNKVGQSRTWAQAALGPLFRCSVDPVVGAVSPPGKNFGSFPLNWTIYGVTDRERFGAQAAKANLTAPCEWIGEFDIQGVVRPQCGGSFTITETTLEMNVVPATDVATGQQICDQIFFSGDINKVTKLDQNTYTGGYNIEYNVTTTDDANALNVTKGQTICITVLGIGTGRIRMAFANDPAQLATCPDAAVLLGAGFTEAEARSYQVAPNAANPNACDQSINSKINPQDVCFGVFDFTGEFRCFSGYYERIDADEDLGFRSWFATSGRRFEVMRGRLSECSANGIYGFFNIPLPPEPIAETKARSFWDKYGAIVLGVTIPVVLILLVLAFVLYRLFRYRQKYKIEQREVNQLKEEADEMAQNWGGFGIAGDEIVMVANPLVLQLNEQKKKLDEVNKNLEQKEELDRMEMDKLDKERQTILEEMKRIERLLQAERGKKQAKRVDDAPAVSGPTQEFQPDGGSITYSF